MGELLTGKYAQRKNFDLLARLARNHRSSPPYFDRIPSASRPDSVTCAFAHAAVLTSLRL